MSLTNRTNYETNILLLLTLVLYNTAVLIIIVVVVIIVIQTQIEYYLKYKPESYDSII